MIDPFPLLLAGHAVGDWLIQTDWQAAHKARPSEHIEAMEIHWQHRTPAVGESVSLMDRGVEGRIVRGRQPGATIERLGHPGTRRPDLTCLVAVPPTREEYWTSWVANQIHVATYSLTLWLATLPLWWTSHARDQLAVSAVLIFSWIIHSFIDRRWPVRWLLAHTGSAKFAETPLGMLAADQALHIATLAIMAAYLQAVIR